MTTTDRLSPQAVLPLHTLDPDAPEGDLSWLDDLIGEARVVALGESGHFTREYLQLRDRVMRYLVRRHGFSACAWESGLIEGRAVADWVRGGAGDLGQVLAHGLTSLTGLPRPVRTHLEWLRAHNSTAAKPVGWYGIDLGGGNIGLLPVLDTVLGYLAEADPDYQPDPAIRSTAEAFAVPSVFGIPTAVASYAGLPVAQRQALTAGLAELGDRLTGRQLLYRRATGAEAHEWAVRAVRAVITVDQVLRAMARGDHGSVAFSREATIAEAVEWILGREERVVLGAHNGHVQRFAGSIPESGRLTPMGLHLAERLGADYRVIGTTTGPGQTLGSGFYAGELFEELPAPRPGSLDALLHASHDGPFAVDLRSLAAADLDAVRVAKEQCHGLYYAEVDPVAAYDALIHVPRVSAAEPDPEALAAAPEQVREMFGTWRGSGG